MVLFEINQRFKGHFFNKLRVSFKFMSLKISSFSSLEHGPKDDKSASALQQVGTTHKSPYRISHLEVFCKKGAPRNFAKFTGKYLCQSIFFNKVAGLSLQLF